MLSLLKSKRRVPHFPITVRPTEGDIAIARTIARNTSPQTEDVAEFLTWGADEHVLCALAAVWWIWTRSKSPDARLASDHVLLTTVAVTALPHLLKTMFNQERPDRLTFRGHVRGVPVSGKRLDAFPSGHAIHVGALASAATQLPPAKRNLVWSAGAAIVATRIVLLAHWMTDVLAGLAVGATVERLLRLATGFGRRRRVG
ncbi:MAG: phosphatase PAP2 family protein [Bradyrhizobium sp.]|uniref:phosphatase PAP2 family protein n=1 Tax=Bradyrhizobium sp. TaxID=376 RepID=UPI001C2A052E|nr:phosphatase PAP2 family protein [Bradyrhizobium sp.]MBU6462594.1 phosphatase PAP2 family protein [Pseudomonadota bacterium]MDE2067215.1 phosphatase PAP2 family protein [Bradyrhizobium sp.]